ncbi:hypothetical protein EDD22DRAFT_962240 [Suillus occidentalis]|nr:hypothetical protein EDD22DRAFT_962240 [Suillus occidentalis]
MEAYILDGTITKAGLAFSRDGPKKVYIQHLMLEGRCGSRIAVEESGGALVGALVKNEGHTPESAGEFLMSLKEEERDYPRASLFVSYVGTHKRQSHSAMQFSCNAVMRLSTPDA